MFCDCGLESAFEGKADIARVRPLSADRRYALDHGNALSECSNIQKILPKILFLTAGGILLGIAYVSDRCSFLTRQSGPKA
jgi:hypothetical protein